jgi:hypothetical protein
LDQIDNVVPPRAFRDVAQRRSARSNAVATRMGSERIRRRPVVWIDEASAVPVGRAGFVHSATDRGGPGMHSVFYIIGVIVVVLAILSLLGLN